MPLLKSAETFLVFLFLGLAPFAAGQELDDPLLSSQWHLVNRGENGATRGVDLHVTNTWARFRGKGVVIGIVDDGIDLKHPDLAGRIDPALGYDWNDDDAVPEADPDKGDFHGTQCAGAAAAMGNNGIGVAGVAYEATIAPLRLISGDSTDEMEADAFLFKNEEIHIKSNSWGPEDDGQTLEAPGPMSSAALVEAVKTGRGGRGTIFLWPAGNGRDVQDDANYDGWANSIYSITAGSVSDQGFQTDFSEPGACVLVCAPSGSFGRPGIATTDLQGAAGSNSTGEPGDFADLNYTRSFAGTSASVALAAGGVALMLEANPDLGWRDVQEILIRSAKPVDEHHPDWAINAAGLHFNHSFGAGLMQVDEAVSLALNWRNLPAQTNASAARANLKAAIPDNTPDGVEFSFDFSRTNLRVEHATLTVDIEHASRGDLTITLISPSGMESRLAEPHDDENADFNHWTFSSVRHWGENAQGIWRVRIADLKPDSSGKVDALRLDLFGADGGEPNPLSIGAVTISDRTGGNGNDAAEPGETIEAAIALRNSGTNAVTGSARLVSRTAGVQVMSEPAAISEALNIRFKIGEGVPCRATLLFDLVTEAGGIVRTNSFRLPTGPPPAVWQVETIDREGLTGSYTSLALDEAGRAHVSYYDATNGDLKYAVQQGAGWRIETVDAEGDSGSYSSLALDSAGRPHISYRDATRLRLKIAAWTGSAWEIETVPAATNAGSFCSLALARDGTPRVAFQDGGGNLVYAAKTAANWQFETVASGNNADISLALTSEDEPMISYRDAAGKTLRFAERSSGSWQAETLDAEGSTGFNSSLVIGRDGQPRIAYRNSGAFDLKYAQRSAGGWRIETVDQEGAVGSDASLALDSAERPHISYRDISNNSLKHAFWNGSFWALETVDADGSVGSYSSIAIDRTDRIRITYRDTSNGDLKSAFRENGECAVFQTAPTLAISREGAFLHLSWSGRADLVVERTGTLNPAAWEAIALMPTVEGNRLSVRVPLADDTSFYRLRAPL